jgi:hypothetical protein
MRYIISAKVYERKKSLGRARHSGRILLKFMASEYRRSGLIWLGITRTVDFKKRGNERMGYTKGAEFLEVLIH